MVEDFKRDIPNQEELAEGYFRLAKYQWDNRDELNNSGIKYFKQIKRLLKSARKFCPNTKYLNLLGQVYFELNEQDAAQKCADAVLKREGVNLEEKLEQAKMSNNVIESLLLKADVYEHREQYATGIEMLLPLTEMKLKKTDLLDIHCSLAYLNKGLDLYGESERHIREALECNPADTDLLWFGVELNEDRCDIDADISVRACISYLDELVKINIFDYKARYVRGNFRVLKGSIVDGIRDMELAVKHDSEIERKNRFLENAYLRNETKNRSKLIKLSKLHEPVDPKLAKSKLKKLEKQAKQKNFSKKNLWRRLGF